MKNVHGRNVNHQCCPVVEAAKWVGDFWNLLILRQLLQKPHRYSQLLESIEDLNKATLSQKLKGLMEVGLVRRQVSTDLPPQTLYQVTPLGRKLKPLIRELERFGQHHFPVD